MGDSQVMSQSDVKATKSQSSGNLEREGKVLGTRDRSTLLFCKQT
jgi:hypothetical protein